MENDSSPTGYHQSVPGFAGSQSELEDDWGDDYAKTFSINLIWAQAFDKQGRPGAIGFEGGMPWHLPEDLRHFKELTVSHPVIMGRKTWESLPAKQRPLPNRDNIVISHDRTFRAPGAVVVCDLEEALDIARQEAIPDDGLDRSEIWVIGGAQLFAEVLPIASKIYITQIDTTVDADTYAPDMTFALEQGKWQIADQSAWYTPKEPCDITRFRYITLVRAPKPTEEQNVAASRTGKKVSTSDEK